MTVSISISQIVRSWVAISQLRPPKASLFCSLYDMAGLAPRICVLRNICFHRVSATGMASRQGTLTPPDTWSRPFGTCICSTCWDQSFFRTCRYFSGLCSSNILRYFLDFVSFWGRRDFQISFSSRDTPKELLRSSLRKLYGRYGDLIKQYEVPLSWILNDILWPGNIQWQPTTDQTLYQAVTLLQNSTYRILRGFHLRIFATGVACRQGTLTPTEPGPVPLGLAYVLLVETNPFSELVMIFRTLLFEHPSVLSRFVLVTLGDIIMLQTYYFL